MKNARHTSGFAPAKKSLGQNFLCDPNIARKIVEAVDIRPGDKVLEIGPGRGALTEHALKRDPGRYVVLELDDALADALSARHPQIEVVRGNALAYPWTGLAGDDGWKIFGNLPYNVASPLIWDIVSQARFERAVFMVQLEAAQRLVAPSGGRQYGALSVFVQSHARAELLFRVPPQVFRPQPKVTSAVVRFFLLPTPLDAEQGKRLAATLRICFQMRRKQLGTILKSNNIPDYDALLRALDIDPVQRPETLAPERFQALSKALPFDFLA
ncbi:MAG: ribosomal RNA small subunit methyltransferase A [Desulfovibrionaceae bacterium CG1_02_65_16]|nr:MAG: ribosomal RNA small subunit methyltransferase A [Desulfovibrionaceae bacterium CG1_02_65_16]